MVSILNFGLSFLFLTMVMFNCTSNVDEDFESFAEELNGGGGSSTGSGPCPVGTWYAPACGDPHGVVWKFNNDQEKTGSFSNKDCNGVCTPMVFTFTYSMSGTTCNITYDAEQPIVKCTGYQDSRPPKPKDASITITCSGDELTVSSGNGTQVFTKN